MYRVVCVYREWEGAVMANRDKGISLSDFQANWQITTVEKLSNH